MISSIKQKLDLKKPHAMGWGEWEDWHEETKRARPFAYFIMETIPDKIDDLKKMITRPYNNARAWLRYRIFDRYHVISTGLAPDYYDADTRMLHGMFNLLVDYVEVELAWVHVVFSDEKRKKRTHPWWSLGWTRFKSFRDPQAGLDHLRWEMTLDSPALSPSERNPYQAAKAREVWELYHWWKFIRPTRPDPHDESGWSDYCAGKNLRDLFSDRDDEDQARSMEMINRTNEIEKAYDQEDEDMLVRLVKIRKSLWT